MPTEPEPRERPTGEARAPRDEAAPREAAPRDDAAPKTPRLSPKGTAQGIGIPAPRALDVSVGSSPGDIPSPTDASSSAATRSVATIDLSGLLATSPGAVRRRLLGPWAEGLRQYLALRLGDIELAAKAFSALKAQVEAVPMEDMVRAPGARARIYRMAHALAAERPKAGQRSLAFRAPLRPKSGYAEALVRLREGLDPDQAELLELRWARELSVDEIVYVLESSADDVQLALGRAVTRARELLAEHGRRDAAHDSVAVAVVDAFALAKSPAASEGARGSLDVGLEAGTVIGGRYRIAKQVGAGAFGEVYYAEDQDVPGHVVALKILREPALSEMVREHHLRELKLIAAVFHPSVVHFKDHGWFEDRLWFVMPWYEGETLERRMRKVEGLARADARRLFEPVARALATLHGSGIRHQDIKPDNIFLAQIHGAGDDDGTLPVLLDLGVAATEHEALIGGTPVYFAPEVASHYAMKPDAPEVGPPADVFALALSLRNALEPETEEDVPAGAVEAFIERRSRTAPPSLTRPDLLFLRPHFDRWLSLDPAQRPTAEQFAHELTVLTEPEEKADRRRRALSIVVPIVAIALTVVGALGYVYVREVEISQREIHAARNEAARARDDVERVSSDLVIEEARREAVETDHAALRRRYDEERLTRDELSSRLATAEGEIGILRSRVTAILAERDVANGELASTRGLLGTARAEQATMRRELERVNADVAGARAQLATESLRAEGLEERVAEVERRAATDLETARARSRELEASLAESRAGVEDLRRRMTEAETRATEANAARARAEDARDAAERTRDRANDSLAEAERTVALLRRRLALREGGEGDTSPEAPAPPAP